MNPSNLPNPNIPTLSNYPRSNKLLYLLLGIIVVAIILGLVFFLLGKNQRFSVQGIPSSIAPVTQKVILNPLDKWGKVVTDVSIELRLEGQVSEIKEGVLQGGVTGRQFTLTNGDNKAVVFVREQADTFEGTDFLNPQTWSPEKGLGIIKPGDRIIIRAQSPFNPQASINNFYGWWVFKLLSK